MDFANKLINITPQSKKYLFCPSENCFNVPEIIYSFNPFKTEVQYKCKCINNYDKTINMNLQEFLEKSDCICYECKKIMNDTYFLLCNNCKVIICNNCKRSHEINSAHYNYELINNNILLNHCIEHINEDFIFRCMNCKESFCYNCDIKSHDKKGHSLKQISGFTLNENNIEHIKDIFEKQKNMFDKIKAINDNIINRLENDIKIKQKIINSFIDNKTNYCSIINLKNLFLENNPIYEDILNNILNNAEKKEKIDNNMEDIDVFINDILLPLYYSMMIIKDDSLIDGLINNMENKIIQLKLAKINYINNNNKLINYNEQESNINNNYNNYYLNYFDKNKNNINMFPNTNNNNNIYQSNKAQSFPTNFGFANSHLNSNIQREENIEHNELSLFSNLNDLSTLNLFNEQIKEEKAINNDKNKTIKPTPYKNKNKTPSEKKKPKERKNKPDMDKEEEKKKKKINNKNEQNNNFVNNMVALKSGNFAISIKRMVEIYDFTKLNYYQNKEVFDDKLIKEKCLLQKIKFDKGAKGKFIAYIFQFVDETLLCPVYSKIIRIKLTNKDKDHEIIGCIYLEHLELSRKIISLGDSMLAILSEKGDNCNIKIYSKKKEQYNNNINSFDLLNNEMNSICQTFGIFDYNKQSDSNIIKEKENIITNNLNNENVNNNSNNNNIFNPYDINEDPNFKMILDKINEQDKLYASIFEIKKPINKNNEDINSENYLYEFIATSNAEFAKGEDKVIFYGLKKIFGKYKTSIIKEINGISCSGELDTICQLNKKYICIGLQNYDKTGQKNGFALIDIYKRELYRIIEDGPISSLCFIKEKQLLLATMEIIEKDRYFSTKVYKLIKNKENEDKEKYKYELENIYQHRNKQYDVITSIHPINNHNLDKNIIFVTSSQSSDLEIINAEIKN